MANWANDKRLLASLIFNGTFLLVLILGVRAYLAQRTGIAVMDTTIQVQKEKLAELSARQTQAALQAKSQVAVLEKVKKHTKSPQEIVSRLPEYLPLPDDIQLIESPVELAKLQSPEPVAVIPHRDLKPLFDFSVECRECQIKLAAAESQLVAEREKNAVISKQLDLAVRTAHGNSGFWHRLIHDTKLVTFSAAVGFVAGAALVH